MALEVKNNDPEREVPKIVTVAEAALMINALRENILALIEPKLGTRLDLTNPEHLLTFSKNVDWNEVLIAHPKITRYDAAFGLIRSTIHCKLSPIVDDDQLFNKFLDGVLGRVYYNPPDSEYAWRIKQLTIIEELAGSKLNDLLPKIREILGEVMDAFRVAVSKADDFPSGSFGGFGDSFHNPLFSIHLSLKRCSGIAALVDQYTEWSQSRNGYYAD